jgi:hypothetical protein
MTDRAKAEQIARDLANLTAEDLREAPRYTMQLCETAASLLDEWLRAEPVAWMTEESQRRLARGGNDSRGTVPVHVERGLIASIPLYAAPPAAPEGYVLVPMEPTKEMIVAGGAAQGEACPWWGEPAVCYRAMLAAAKINQDGWGNE